LVCAIARAPASAIEVPPRKCWARAACEGFGAFDNELGGRALKPGRHHVSVGVPHGAEPLPFAGVAPEHPVFDQVTNGKAVENCRVSHARMSSSPWAGT